MTTRRSLVARRSSLGLIDGGSNMNVKDYKQLRVWQRGIEIVDKVYALTDKFPREELYGLTAQMRKASVSIPSNVAEGFVRGHPKEYRYFLYISLGSCAELDTQSIIANRRRYITEDELRVLAEDLDHEARMLTSLINRVDSKSSDERRGTSDELC
jgi:four helix bundle protein